MRRENKAVSNNYTFLLVDDSEEDAFLLRRALAKAKIPDPVQVLTSGELAIAHFSGAGEYSNRQKFPLPALAFIDLNLPGMDGWEVMGWLQGQIHLRHIRVVALTSSLDGRLSSQVRALGGDGLFVKTHGYQDVTGYAQSFGMFSQLVQPPPATGR